MASGVAGEGFSLQWTIGAATITSVLEMDPFSADPSVFIRTTAAEVLKNSDWLCPDFAGEDGTIILNFQAFIVDIRGTRIMVDTCFGNDKPRENAMFTMLSGPFLERLNLVGYPPESIDYVLCTHLHTDHTGWNTRLVDGEWVPTFPNARYLFAQAEYDHARTDERGNARAIFADSVEPIVEAGLARFVGPDYVIVDEVRLVPTPGHTPGHCSVVIASEGQRAVISGDALHHPLQVALPDVGDNFSWDDAAAKSSRRRLLEGVASSGALLLGSHFSGPVGVYLEPHGDAWKIANSRQPERTAAPTARA
jgi:glyoxylase-like metal-dependent hydrolase (beta-lactamase superfamily II)